jgi:hypothetical protein
MSWKRQIGGILTLVGLAVMAGASGWWWLTRGGVVDRVELFSQTKVTVAKTERVTAALRMGDNVKGAWELGPYKLGPEDSPISIAGSFNATGALAQKKPTFTLKAYLFNEAGDQVWDGQSAIRWANSRSDADVSGVELMLGNVPIHQSGKYMLYCNTDEEFSRRGGAGTGAMKLDLVIRRQAKSFPLIPVIGGFVVLLVAIFGFGEKVQKPVPVE